MLTVRLVQLLTTDNLLKNVGKNYSQHQVKSQRSALRFTLPRRSSLPGGESCVLQYFILGVYSTVYAVLCHTNVLYARYLTIASHHPLRRSLTLRRHLLPHFPRSPHKRQSQHGNRDGDSPPRGRKQACFCPWGKKKKHEISGAGTRRQQSIERSSFRRDCAGGCRYPPLRGCFAAGEPTIPHIEWSLFFERLLHFGRSRRLGFCSRLDS